MTIALYIPVLGHSFVVLDDRDYVTANPHIHESLSWTTIKWAFTSTYAANWHPLTWFSHTLDYQLFGLNPVGHHLDSVLIHALNAALLFLLLAWITKRVGRSLLVAALFALHPINVESVAWVAERKNVLSTLFFILAISAYAWYAQKPGWSRYLLVGALFAAGLMAKPMIITLPFVFLLLDYWPLGRMARLYGFPCERAAIDRGEVGAGENPVALALSWQCMDYARRAANWSGSAYVRTVPTWYSHRECGRVLRAVSVENGLAGAACALSPFSNCSAGVAMDSIGHSVNERHRLRSYLSQNALFAGWLVLVSGHVSSCHRPGAGGRKLAWRIATPIFP